MKIKTIEFINHGVVNIGDLPIPFDMVLNASALVVVITFVYLKISWKESIVVPSKRLACRRQDGFDESVCRRPKADTSPSLWLNSRGIYRLYAGAA